MKSKDKIKKKILTIVDKLIDSADVAGNINYFEINIKHINGEINTNLVNKYKEKVG